MAELNNFISWQKLCASEVLRAKFWTTHIKLIIAYKVVIVNDYFFGFGSRIDKITVPARNAAIIARLIMVESSMPNHG